MSDELTLNDIFSTLRGRASDGSSNCVGLAQLIIDHENEKTDIISQLNILDSTFEVYNSGGCTVVVIDFPKSDRLYREDLEKMLDKYFSECINNEKMHFVLHLFPLGELKASIEIIYQSPVYSTTIEQDGFDRFILALDDTLTEFTETGIDYDKIKENLLKTEAMEEAALDEEIASYENQLKKIKEMEDAKLNEHFMKLSEEEDE